MLEAGKKTVIFNWSWASWFSSCHIHITKLTTKDIYEVDIASDVKVLSVNHISIKDSLIDLPISTLSINSAVHLATVLFQLYNFLWIHCTVLENFKNFFLRLRRRKKADTTALYKYTSLGRASDIPNGESEVDCHKIGLVFSSDPRLLYKEANDIINQKFKCKRLSNH